MVVEEGENFELRFAEAIASLLNHPIDQAVLRESSKSFSWEATVKREIEIYETVKRPNEKNMNDSNC